MGEAEGRYIVVSQLSFAVLRFLLPTKMFITGWPVWGKL